MSKNGLRVLIIDDDEIDYMQYKRMLEHGRHVKIDTVGVHKPGEVSAILRQQEFDCILLDYLLPEVDGLTLFNALAKEFAEKLPPVIMLTGEGDEYVAVSALSQGVSDYVVKRDVTAQFLEMHIINAIKKHDQIRKKQIKDERLMNLAFHDDLTQLYNRRAFEDLSQRYVANARRQRQLMALLFIDVDDFKLANDRYGHPAGDRLLQKVAEALTENIRRGDVVARIGGDEFAVILSNVRYETDAGRIAAKLISHVDEVVMDGGHKFKTSISIGISMFNPSQPCSHHDLMQNADIAVIYAKSMGKKQYQYYSKERHSEHLKRIMLEEALQLAIDNKELFIEYQPIYDLKKQKATALEALLRWRHHKIGLVMPDVFIAIAEEIGIMKNFTLWVVSRILADYKKHIQPLPHTDICLSFNLSSLHLDNKKFITDLYDAVVAAKVKPGNICLEIRESAVCRELSENEVKALAVLDGMGFKLSIDDFGEGYTALSKIAELPIKQIKIDDSLISDMVQNPKKQAVVRSIIDLCQNLNIEVIAEGVETAEQQAILARLGCMMLQGFVFSIPKPIEEIIPSFF